MQEFKFLINVVIHFLLFFRKSKERNIHFSSATYCSIFGNYSLGERFFFPKFCKES